MSEVKLYLFSDPNQKGSGIGLNQSGQVHFTDQRVEVLPSETDSSGNVTTVTMTTTIKGTITALLSKLDYTKQMYEPGVINATLSLTAMGIEEPAYKQVKKDKNGKVLETKEGGHSTGLLKTVPITRDKIMSALSHAKAELRIDGNVVAEHYFVYKVRTLHKKNAESNVSVELTIFSEDKLLTLEKYSKAYTAKKLGADIFKSEIGNFNLSDATSYGVSLQLLSYDSDKKELRQPYLVQYNESFYDFLKRTANRCGEFLYHEGGKLHLGVALNRLDLDKTDNNGNILATPVDYATVAHERYYESLYDGDVFSNGDTVEDYAYNYLNKEENAEHYANSKNGKFHYNDPLVTDEYLDDIGTKYTTYGGEYDEIEKIAMSQLLLALSGTSFSEIVDNFALAAVSNAVDAAVNEGSKNGDNEEVNISPWKDGDNPKAGTEDQWNGNETLRQFGTYGKKKSRISENSVNLNAMFYSLVRKAEKKVGEDAVWLEFGEDAQNLKLGDVVKVETVSYLVVKIFGKYEYKSESETEMIQEVVAIPLYTVPSTSSTADMIAIPFALKKEVAVREAHPQLAFVAENLDPMKIGRVRIRFAWQEESGDVSPWIRVALPFATNGGGIKFKPEKGDEVLVAFEEGNVERPYVSGYLLSERSNESWGSLSDRVIMSKNGHGITFTDGAGSDFFYKNLGPMKGLFRSWFPTSVWPDTLEDKASCAALSGGIKLRDQYGLYEISASSDERTVKIESAMGDVTLNAFTGITVSAPNGNIKIAGKNVEIAASNILKLSSGSALKDRFFPNSASGDISLPSVGGIAIKTTWDTVLGLGKGLVGNIVDKLLDLSLIRTVLEVVLRPIDGTTSIKSSTFLEIQAGKGSVEIPPERVIKTDQPNTFPDVRNALDAIASTVVNNVETINNAAQQLAEKLNRYKDLSGDADGMINKSEGAIGLATVKGKGWKASADQLKEDDVAFKWDAVGLKDEELVKEDDAKQKANDEISKITGTAAEPKQDDARYTGDNPAGNYDDDHKTWQEAYDKNFKDANAAINARNQERKDKRTTLVGCVNDLASAFSGVFKAFDDIKKMANLVSQNTITEDNKNKAIASIKKYGDYIGASDHKLFDALANNKVDKDTDFTQEIGDDVKKMWKRKAIIDYLGQVTQTVNDAFSGDTVMIASLVPIDVMNDILWGAGIDAMFTEKQISWGGDMLDHIKDSTIGAVKEWAKDDIWHPMKSFGLSVVGKHRWKTGVHGKILMSDSPSMTISFDRDGNPVRQLNTVGSDKSIFELRDYIKSL